MPAPSEPANKPQEEEEEEEEEVVDDKLYCICKTSYDEDKVMIACDRYVTVQLSLLASAQRILQVRRVVPHTVFEHERPRG